MQDLIKQEQFEIEVLDMYAPHFCEHFLVLKFVKLYATFFPFYRDFYCIFRKFNLYKMAVSTFSKGFSITYTLLAF